MREITVYTTDHCSRCVSAKALLQRRGLDFTEVNLARDPDSRSQLAARTGMATFPQIVVDGEAIGGFDQLVAADRAGLLRGLAA